jgi:RNA polymerase sigma-70 factor (ECF subfamily)
MNVPSDRDLIQRARRGGDAGQAYGELVTRYQTSVFNVCYRILHERTDAEDLAQESFLRAHERLNTFDEERPFGPWIRRIAANMCLNHLSSQKFTNGLDEERDAAESPGPERVQEARERNARVETLSGNVV